MEASSWITSASGGLVSSSSIFTLTLIPGWPSSWRLGWSLPGRHGVALAACSPSTLVAVHRVLRPSVSVARCLSTSPAAHRCRRSNSAIRRPSFAPLAILGMLLLWCPFFNRVVFHSGSSDVCVDILGVASAALYPSTSVAVHPCRAFRSRWRDVFRLLRRHTGVAARTRLSDALRTCQ